ncbi:MAG: hypothetical protein AB1595_02735 [bacterium]
MNIKVRSQESGVRSQNYIPSYILYSTFCILIIVCGCKKKEEVKEEKPKPPIPIEVSPPKYETYQYLDLGRRDPFVPLKGPGVIKMPKEVEVVIERGTKTEEGEMSGWIISGYIFDKKEKIAVIKAEEENYLFVDNKLLDKDGNDVSEIKVKTKEDGIILTKKGKELFLKMEEKEIREEIQ